MFCRAVILTLAWLHSFMYSCLGSVLRLLAACGCLAPSPCAFVLAACFLWREHLAWGTCGAVPLRHHAAASLNSHIACPFVRASDLAAALCLIGS